MKKNYGYDVKILLDVGKRSLTPEQFAKFNALTIAAGMQLLLWLIRELIS